MFQLKEIREMLLKGNSPLSKLNDIQLLCYFYPQLFIGAARKRRDEILKYLRPSVVLDAGCGRGWLSLDIAKNSYYVIAVDLSKRRIKEAKVLFETERIDIPLIRGSLTHLPFKDTIFDSIICCGVIEHIPDVGFALSEMKRVLRNNGRLCLTVPNGYGSWGIIHDIILPKFGLGGKGIELEHVHKFTSNNLKCLIYKSGFKILSFFNSEILTPLYGFVLPILNLNRLSWQILERADVESAKKLPLWFGGIWVMICQRI